MVELLFYIMGVGWGCTREQNVLQTEQVFRPF